MMFQVTTIQFINPGEQVGLSLVVENTSYGKENFMTVGFVSRVNANPPMLGIGIGKPHYTTKGLLENREFSLAFPSPEQVQKSDYVGIFRERKWTNRRFSKLFMAS